MSRQPDPFEGAKCRTPEHWEWMRANRASKWDWHLDNETDLAAKQRRRWAVGQCAACPELVRQRCRERHSELSAAQDLRVPGIWGGRAWPDKEPRPPATGQDALPYDQDVAA